MKNINIILVILLLFTSSSIFGQRKKVIKLTGKLISNNEVQCITEERTNPDSKTDSIIVKTCLWHNYKFVMTGIPDYRGRYGYAYELFFIDKEQQKKITNSGLFNEKINKLEDLINEIIKNDFDNYKSDPGLSNCLDGVKFKRFKMDDMGISFNERNEIEFNVTFGLGQACYNDDGTSVSFDMSDLKEYLK
jgi:hypothetical protein